MCASFTVAVRLRGAELEPDEPKTQSSAAIIEIRKVSGTVQSVELEPLWFRRAMKLATGWREETTLLLPG